MGFLDTLSSLTPALTAIGGIASGVANFAGAGAQGDAAERAAGITQGQFDQIRADNEPFRQAGVSALSRLLAENIGPLEETPDFLFARDQGQQAIERSAAARGKLLSGEAVKDATRFGTGIARQAAGDRRQTLASIAGFGPGAASTTANAGIQTSGLLSGLALQQGAANASSFAAPVNAFNSTLNDLVGQAALRGKFS